ncbi:hypothetical protein FH972_023605 [Carpinus fangiana]|uniref:Acetyl-CoA acetyltransferase n=1 Tax=Carpinus fangiana TaxID=176857 RepID=A0A5N6KVN4_9ROSI|nr:hypothetical protein FH972_023605 [Carpinus fangiana]
MASARHHILRHTRRSFSSTPRAPRELQDAYILSAARTPVGVFGGSLSSVPAPQLAGVAIKAALDRAGLPSPPTTAYIGNVLSAGVGQAPARQAVLAAGLPTSTEATTINKVCASGLKAVTLAGQQVALGLEQAVLAGGMENMSRVPYLYPRAGQLPPFGHVPMRDAMIADGLWDVYNDIHMGSCAEATTKKHNISRKQQDDFAIESYSRAQQAWRDGAFAAEVVPVTVKGKKGDTVVEQDEGYNKLKLEKVPTLRPAFAKDGTVTAANSSSFNDGASAVVVVDAALAKAHGEGSGVLARIVSSADAATEPIDFTVAPALAVPLALKRAGLEIKDISVWEINEAFAAVVVANAKLLGLDGRMDIVNPRGGAISLGHAIGSSGCRILTTLLHQLKPGQYGCAAICNGGGAASAMIVQRVDAV